MRIASEVHSEGAIRRRNAGAYVWYQASQDCSLLLLLYSSPDSIPVNDIKNVLLDLALLIETELGDAINVDALGAHETRIALDSPAGDGDISVLWPEAPDLHLHRSQQLSKGASTSLAQPPGHALSLMVDLHL